VVDSKSFSKRDGDLAKRFHFIERSARHESSYYECESFVECSLDFFKMPGSALLLVSIQRHVPHRKTHHHRDRYGVKSIDPRCRRVRSSLQAYMDMFHTERRITIAIDTASKASIRDVGVYVPPCKHIWTCSTQKDASPLRSIRRQKHRSAMSACTFLLASIYGHFPRCCR